jgi:hypothetical protein
MVSGGGGVGKWGACSLTVAQEFFRENVPRTFSFSQKLVPEEDSHRAKFIYLYQRVRQFVFLRCPKKGPNGLIRYWFDAFLGTRTISKPQISAISASGTNAENGPLF